MVTVKEMRQKLKDNDYDIFALTQEEQDIFSRFAKLRENEGRLVKHFKGGIYLLEGFVTNTETGDFMVLYKAMYGDYERYVRPIDMFMSEVDTKKYPNCSQKYRFELVEIVGEDNSEG